MNASWHQEGYLFPLSLEDAITKSWDCFQEIVSEHQHVSQSCCEIQK